MNNIKNKLLNNIIKYAYNENQYYKKLFDTNKINTDEIWTINDLSRIPFLEKETIQKEFHQIISNPYKKFPKNQSIEVRRTSGSTGEYLKIYWDIQDNLKSMLPLWRVRQRLYSIDPNMKYCRFYTVDYRGNKIQQPELEQIALDGRLLSFYKAGLTYERLKECYEKILSFNPDWLNLQPSIAYLLAQVVKNYGLKIPSNLKYIELSGELLLKQYRKNITEVFNIDPVDLYGTSEVNGIAIECKNKAMHILNDNVIVEVVKNGTSVINEEGDIYITSLTSHAMPFIRYGTGDKGIISQEVCKCGNVSNILKLSSGRTGDFIVLGNGKQITNYILVGIIEYTNEYMSNVIEQFQFIQTDICEFDVILVLKEEYKHWQMAVQKAFLKNVNDENLVNAKWNFYFLDRILPDYETGKVQYFKKLK